MRHRKPLSLSKAFNDVSRHPARCFELGNNLRGIAGHYKIPQAMTACAYEAQTIERMHEAARRKAQRKNTEVGYFWEFIRAIKSPKFLLESWDELVRLNPVLGKIQMNKQSAEDLFNAHMGVTSGFNINDINFYIEQTHQGGFPARQARNMPDHGARINRLENVSPVPIE